jgi:hypothetical protein
MADINPTDILRGVPAIAKYLNQSERQTYHQLERGSIPGAFKLKNARIWQLLVSKYRRAIEEMAA